MIELCLSFILSTYYIIRVRPTACVTRKWAGEDSFRDVDSAEAWKMPVNRAESHLSGARFVRCALDFKVFGFRAQHPKLKLEYQYLKLHVVPNPKRTAQSKKRLMTYLLPMLSQAQFLFRHQ